MRVQELLKQEKKIIDQFFLLFPFHEMEKVIEECLTCRGLLFFSGVGKSGLVAKKIAVTLVSTGTKACFLSPHDAAHGDLGLVGKEDICFLLSKSGESNELLELIPFLRNKGAKVISVVCSKNSRLEKASDLPLYLPLEKELCPFDMAPTASSTIQMIFGDLLTVSLMKEKKFTLHEYASNHPAGKIGRRLSLKVKDLMIQGDQIPICSLKDPLGKVLVELTNKQCGCLCVTDQEKSMHGIFTDGDLRRALQKHGSDVLQKSMQELMNPLAKSISKDHFITDALLIMEENQKKPITVLPVLEEKNKIVGLIKLHDIVQSGV